MVLTLMKMMHFTRASEVKSYSLTFILLFVCEERVLQYKNIWLIRLLGCLEMFDKKTTNEISLKRSGLLAI